ncbi:hypothetical protein NDU88_000920 [Pleurodeles waltl]|uniref:Uncharacterized protein n=1 Tax=Pleurodeles waltl TaxID=8319 RepID=A0AAV7TGU2_PLEWA|nr:hypothetical protein NDU88_000920 [Pleurodeles waltl]
MVAENGSSRRRWALVKGGGAMDVAHSGLRNPFDARHRLGGQEEGTLHGTGEEAWKGGLLEDKKPRPTVKTGRKLGGRTTALFCSAGKLVLVLPPPPRWGAPQGGEFRADVRAIWISDPERTTNPTWGGTPRSTV